MKGDKSERGGGGGYQNVESDMFWDVHIFLWSQWRPGVGPLWYGAGQYWPASVAEKKLTGGSTHKSWRATGWWR